MFNPQISVSPKASEDGGNWEKDVRGVTVEPCDPREDPLGFRAVFVVGEDKPLTQRVNSYVVGASYLRQRLDGIRRAGFEAPMTARAIEMLEDSLKGRKTGSGV